MIENKNIKRKLSNKMKIYVNIFIYNILVFNESLPTIKNAYFTMFGYFWWKLTFTIFVKTMTIYVCIKNDDHNLYVKDVTGKMVFKLFISKLMVILVIISSVKWLIWEYLSTNYCFLSACWQYGCQKWTTFCYFSFYLVCNRSTFRAF